MNLNLGLFLLYTMITLAAAVVVISISGRDPWKRAIVGCFLAVFFVYSGIGLSESSFTGADFALHYTAYALFFPLAFILTSRARFDATVKVSAPRLKDTFSLERVRRSIIALYILSLLIPLLTPNFRLLDLFSPPSINFLDVFAENEGLSSDIFSRMSRYLTTLLFAPFLLAIAATKRSPVLVGCIFLACIYVEYVTSRYFSRSSILLYMLLYFTYLLFEYPHRRASIIGLALTTLLLAAAGAAWFVEFRLGSVDYSSLAGALYNMIEIELNFPRDAGLPLLRSGEHGSILEYIVWITTLPVPKAIFGQFINLNINLDIGEIITGLSPGDFGFFVPLPGALFSSIYSLGIFFWLEPIALGSLAGIAYRTIKKYDNSHLLKLYILVACSYSLNRAGAAGSAFQLYNSFFWILILWSPAFSALKLFGRRSLRQPQVAHATS
jgi:hypothetical protein